MKSIIEIESRIRNPELLTNLAAATHIHLIPLSQIIRVSQIVFMYRVGLYGWFLLFSNWWIVMKRRVVLF